MGRPKAELWAIKSGFSGKGWNKMSTTRRGSSAITLVVTCLGSFMVFLDASIVVTALPTIQNSFHSDLADLQWVVDAFTLPFAALMITGGTLGDRFGRKRFFLLGLILFVIGSAFCGFAPTLSWLLFGRVVQGVGAAALSPGSLSVLVAAFPEARRRTQAIGIWAGLSGLGLAIGPLAGGWLIQVASWPLIFFVNLPLGLLVVALSVSKLSASRNLYAEHIDLPGLILVTGTLFCLIMAIIEGSSIGWRSPLIMGLLIGSAVCFSFFLLVEARVREPMVPLYLFTNRVFSIANTASFVLGFVMMGSLFFLAQFLQDVQGYSAFESGLRTLPASLGIFVVAPFVGRLTVRIGPRIPIVVGALLGSIALFLIAATIQPDTSYSTLWWQIGLFGLGCGFMVAPLATAVLSTISQERSGLGSSLLNTGRQVGITLGVALLGAFVLQQFPGNIAFQLTRHGLPASTSATIAQKLASAGAGARLAPQLGHLSLPQTILHQAISQGFVDTLHGTFFISALCLLTAALLVAFKLRAPKPVVKTQFKWVTFPSPQRVAKTQFKWVTLRQASQTADTQDDADMKVAR